MKPGKLIAALALGLLGIVAAAGITVAANRISGQEVGLSSEPVSVIPFDGGVKPTPAPGPDDEGEEDGLESADDSGNSGPGGGEDSAGRDDSSGQGPGSGESGDDDPLGDDSKSGADSNSGSGSGSSGSGSGSGSSERD